MIGPWILGESQRLTARLGSGSQTGAKLDMSGFLVFIPLYAAYFVISLFYPLVSADARDLASKFTVGILLALGCLVLHREYRPSLEQLGLNLRLFRYGTFNFWVLLATAVSVTRMGLTLSAGEVTHTFHKLSSAMHLQSWTMQKGAYAAASIVVLVVLTPIAEELLFRGYLYLVLRQNWGDLAAALVSSGVFSLLHLNADPLFFLLSLFDIYVNNQAESLIPSTVAHSTWNAMILLLAA